jgi:flavorubredoxin
MQTTTHEIAEGVYRFSTYVPGAGLNFNQFLIAADEPLLFHTGMRGLFPLVSEAIGRVIPLQTLRWIGFGHVEADECGSMNQWLAAAPGAQVFHGHLACNVSLYDLCDRPPRPLANGEVLDLGGKRVRWLDTPHVPHGWEAGIVYEETGGTLFTGDLLTHMGETEAMTGGDILGPAVAAVAGSGFMTGAPNTVPVLRGLADLAPRTLALMHGASFAGDGAALLRGLADYCEGQRKI